MCAETGKKPVISLTKNLNRNILIKLKNDIEYRRRLTQCDGYMNMMISDATEYNPNGPAVEYGNVFIRGNNVIYVSLE